MWVVLRALVPCFRPCFRGFGTASTARGVPGRWPQLGISMSVGNQRAGGPAGTISGVGRGGGAGSAGAPVAPTVRGGVVSRRVLFGRLTGAGRVTVVSAPAGSGKTVLLRSWIGDAGLAERAAWVAVQGGECDPQ